MKMQSGICLEGKGYIYIGFDATADSLTAGHFPTIMAMTHMQRAGHKPIALIGGGTTMIGDPSGRSDMRTMMTGETIDPEIIFECFKTSCRGLLILDLMAQS